LRQAIAEKSFSTNTYHWFREFELHILQQEDQLRGPRSKLQSRLIGRPAIQGGNTTSHQTLPGDFRTILTISPTEAPPLARQGLPKKPVRNRRTRSPA